MVRWRRESVPGYRAAGFATDIGSCFQPFGHAVTLLELLFAGDVAALREARAALLASREQGDPELVARVEAEVAAAPARAIRFDSAGAASVHAAGRTFAGGVFSLPTCGELGARVAASTSTSQARRTRKVRLSALAGADALTDVAALQASAAPGTLFQVASQFNCLEAPGPHLTDVASYVSDPTQGPRAAYSAFPGTLLRHYAAPRDDDGARFVQQDDGPQLDLLARALPAALGAVRGGYLRAGDLRDHAAAARALRAHTDDIRVGVHQDVEVVFGHDWHGAVALADGAPRRITQVLTSTLAGGGYSGRAELTGALGEVCAALLGAAYLGTLRAATALGQHTAVLTLIGGGVFGNPHALIWDAIAAAVADAASASAAAAGDLHVIVNCHSTLADRARVLALVHAHGGQLAEVQRGGAITLA